MIRNPLAVERELYNRVLEGYDPRRDYESVCDHGVDWLVLSAGTFERVKRLAIGRRTGRRTTAPTRPV